MTYYGKPRSTVLFMLIIVTFILRDISPYFLIATVLLFAIVLCRMQLTLDREIYYRITLFNFIVKEKEILPQDLKKIIFKRVGWKRKGAVIALKKGFSIKVNNYSSPSILDDLHKYAMKYSIPFATTKEYDGLIERERRTRYEN